MRFFGRQFQSFCVFFESKSVLYSTIFNYSLTKQQQQELHNEL